MDEAVPVSAIDYQDKINKMVAANQPALAAYYERLRNKKIAEGYGGKEETTYTYQSPYTTDSEGKASGAWAAGTPDETYNYHAPDSVKPDMDYQDAINKAANANQPALAAYYERLRNQKIAEGNGGKETQTNKYQTAYKNGGSTAYSLPSKLAYESSSTSNTYDTAKEEFLKQQIEKKQKAFEEKYASVMAESQKNKNAATGKSAQGAQAFNENASAMGLNSGAMSQQKDASSRVLQNYMGEVDKSAKDQVAALKKSYDDEVEALKKNITSAVKY